MIDIKELVRILIILLIILIIIGFVSLFTGSVGFMGFGGWPEFYKTILFKVRLPRIILAVIVGFGLALSGVVFQALLRNPLADPYILGSSSGAALGASIGLLLGFDAFIYSLPLCAFAFSLISLITVYMIASSEGRMRVEVLLLAGVIVSTFIASVVMLLMSVARRETHEIIFWIMGNLAQTNYTFISVVGILVFAGSLVIYFFSRDLDAISLGEEKAHYLGVETEKLKKILFVVTSLIVGAVVSISGMIGFVGLIIPHIVRLVVGPNHRILIPASGIAGAIFLVISDTIARTIASPIEVPVGIVTALFGAPFFIFLLAKHKRHLRVNI
ncbi:MAG: iron chelate uptake ABC transporter family permease subunit [bacterium]